MRKNMEIEALRGLAVLSVMVGHMPNILYWMPAVGEQLGRIGFGAGVDLFFVISGFVITSAFYDELRGAASHGTHSFLLAMRGFMVRRIFRVMPAAIFWMMIICACSVWFNETGIFGQLRSNFSDLVAVIFNASNIYFAKCLALGAHGTCGYNSVYWSVSLEEQFYLLFPLLVLLPRRWVVVLTGVVAIALIVKTRTIMVWFTRVDGLLAGVCLAFLSRTEIYRKLSQLPLNRYAVRVPLAVGLFVTVLCMPWTALWVPRLYPELVTVGCFLLVGLASANKGFAFGDTRWRDAIAWVGTRSFSVYLVHNPAAWITRELASRLGLLDARQGPLEPVLFAATAFVLVFLLAELTFRLVETPWRRWGRQIAKGDRGVSRQPGSVIDTMAPAAAALAARP